MENVPLRRDALRFVDTTLDVKNGLVGRVRLKIPSRLRSEPWSITLERVYIVVTPQSHDDYDEMQDEAVSQEVKLASLDGIESEWRAKYDNEQAANYYPSYSSWMNFGTSLIGSIIENLQIQIRDVHLRYEDHLSFPRRPEFLFAFGFLLLFGIEYFLAGEQAYPSDGVLEKFTHKKCNVVHFGSVPVIFKHVKFSSAAKSWNCAKS